MNKLSERQLKILDLLADGKWWETPDIRAVFNQDGIDLKSAQVYQSCRALETRGLVTSEKPPSWGNPVRTWRLKERKCLVMSWTRLLESLLEIEEEAHKKEPNLEYIIKQTGKGKKELETLLNEELGKETLDSFITPDLKLWIQRNNLTWKALRKIHLVLGVKFPDDPTVTELGQIITYYEAVLE